MIAIDALLWCLTAGLSMMGALLLLPAAWLLMQMVVAAQPTPRQPAEIRSPAMPVGGIAVLIPAHNEAGGIGATLRDVRSQLRQGDQIVVVADNCADDTAAIARGEGAVCIERFDSSLKGKGYALAFGIEHLRRGARPDHVLILDADCRILPGALKFLLEAASAHVRPVQAAYLMNLPSAMAGVGARISAFAWRIKNLLRPRAGHRLGLPCGLYGTGMLFPWAVAQGLPWASGHLVEDMELWAHLLQSGEPPVFCEQAVVTSLFPEGAEAARRQRGRWERGHLDLIMVRLPSMAVQAVRNRRWTSLLAMLDMAVPPLALLALVSFGFVLTALGAWIAGLANASALMLGMVQLSVLLAAIGVAWRTCGKDLLQPKDLIQLPVYALRKVFFYLEMASGKYAGWTRTRRPGEDVDR